jgi:hypothetical protein
MIPVTKDRSRLRAITAMLGSVLTWAIGSFPVSQIMVGVVVAPLVARLAPALWRGVGVC